MSNYTIPVQIQEFRKIQEGVQTPGSKCRNCFYDIIWDKPTSEQKNGIGKNWPFEMDKGFQHSCPKDEHDHYITRQGYTKDNNTGKVIWIGSGSPPPQQQQLTTSSSNGGTTSTDISAQIGGLTNSIKQLTTAYEQIAMKQNEEIAKLKTIVDEYIRHNPLESSFLELTKRMMSYLPEVELGPKTADQYKAGFESTS